VIVRTLWAELPGAFEIRHPSPDYAKLARPRAYHFGRLFYCAGAHVPALNRSGSGPWQVGLNELLGVSLTAPGREEQSPHWTEEEPKDGTADGNAEPLTKRLCC